MPNFYHVSKKTSDAHKAKHSHHGHHTKAQGKAKDTKGADLYPESEPPQTTTDSKEVWFAGCHCGTFLRHTCQPQFNSHFRLQMSVVVPCRMELYPASQESLSGG